MFIGSMGAGKSYYSDILEKDYGFDKVSLASPIKEMEAGLDNAYGAAEFAELVYPHFKYVKAYGEFQLSEMIHILRKAKEIPREHPKPRQRYQYIGTEGGREIVDPMIWIKILMAKVAAEKEINWVCDDCRFLNEFETLQDTFIPIKIVIDQDTQIIRLTQDYPNFDPDILNHASEQDIAKIEAPHTIDGTLLRDEASRQLKEILKL